MEPDLYLEPHDRHTEVAIRKKIIDDGDFDLEERQIPLKINGELKDVIRVSPKLFKDIKKREFQLELKYSIYTLSKNGRFLNLPPGQKIVNNKTDKEKKRLSQKLKKIVEERKKNKG
jgi:hypothetical protein